MPGSSEIFDTEIGAFLSRTKGCFLDIGPGRGKMGRIARSSGCDPLYAIEIFPPYITEYNLDTLYESVGTGDACAIIDRPDMIFGTVMFGDVIEHMPKSSAMDLLEYLVIRCNWIIIKYPVNTKTSCLYQGSSLGNIYEGHISIWSEADFDRFTLESFEQKESMCLAIIKGYGGIGTPGKLVSEKP